jgi:ABC-type nitrate/sulfonate/bicarbonate transport system substrate-binding protein
MRMHRTLRPTACAILAVIVLHFGVDPARAASPDANQVVIRYLDDAGFVPSFEIADVLGFLKDTNIRLEPKGESPGGPESLAALASGSIDIVGAATPAMINAIAHGAKILCIMPRAGINKDLNSKFFVLDDSPIKSPADLKDRSIAVNTLGAHLDYTVREYLKNHDLTAGDVKLVTVPGPRLDETLRSHQTDVVAVGTWQNPIAVKIRAEGGVKVLFTDYDVLGDIVLAGNAMQTSFLDQHPKEVKEFVTASAKAADWVADHPVEARKLAAEILTERGETAAATVAAASWPGFGVSQHALYKEQDIKFWLDVLVREAKLKPGQFSPEDIATNKYNSFAGH